MGCCREARRQRGWLGGWLDVPKASGPVQRSHAAGPAAHRAPVFVKTAVFTPITAPVMSSKGPPLFPGFTARPGGGTRACGRDRARTSAEQPVGHACREAAQAQRPPQCHGRLKGGLPHGAEARVVSPAASVWMPPPMVLPVWLCSGAGRTSRAQVLERPARQARAGRAGRQGRAGAGLRSALLSQPNKKHLWVPAPGCSQGPCDAPPRRTWKPRPSALTTPVVRVRSKPKGLPMARQAWPTRTCRHGPGAKGQGPDLEAPAAGARQHRSMMGTS